MLVRSFSCERLVAGLEAKYGKEAVSADLPTWQGAGPSEAEVHGAVRRLARLNLVQQHPETREPTAHRLVGAFFRHAAGLGPGGSGGEAALDAAVAGCRRALDDLGTGDVPGFGTPARREIAGGSCIARRPIACTRQHPRRQ